MWSLEHIGEREGAGGRLAMWSLEHIGEREMNILVRGGGQEYINKFSTLAVFTITLVHSSFVFLKAISFSI